METHSDIPGGSETILVVEKNDSERGTTVKSLATMGYHVLEARRGEDALALCEQLEELDESVDLLIAELLMTGICCDELADRILKKWTELKVLITSDLNVNAIDLQRILKLEYPLIQKSFNPVYLAGKVRAILDSPPESNTERMDTE